MKYIMAFTNTLLIRSYLILSRQQVVKVIIPVNHLVFKEELHCDSYIQSNFEYTFAALQMLINCNAILTPTYNKYGAMKREDLIRALFSITLSPCNHP